MVVDEIRQGDENMKWRKRMEIIKEKDIRLNIRLPEKLREEFRAACARRCVNGSELIRRFIEEWTSKNK